MPKEKLTFFLDHCLNKIVTSIQGRSNAVWFYDWLWNKDETETITNHNEKL